MGRKIASRASMEVEGDDRHTEHTIRLLWTVLLLSSAHKDQRAEQRKRLSSCLQPQGVSSVFAAAVYFSIESMRVRVSPSSESADRSEINRLRARVRSVYEAFLAMT